MHFPAASIHYSSGLTFSCLPKLLCYLQQDIARGRGMVDELFQGWGGTAGTQNAVLSSSDYISQAQRTFNNVEDGEHATQSTPDLGQLAGLGYFLACLCMFPCVPAHPAPAACDSQAGWGFQYI
jgi:hypothetical protein